MDKLPLRRWPLATGLPYAGGEEISVMCIVVKGYASEHMWASPGRCRRRDGQGPSPENEG